MGHGFETYMPRIRENKRTVPLFPTYVFVRVADRWYPIVWTAHVVRMLMAGDKPAQLGDAIVDSIRKREIGGLVKLPKPERQFKRGQKVSIIAGSFAGQVGLYDGMCSR